jgi:hypothetical protein
MDTPLDFADYAAVLRRHLAPARDPQIHQDSTLTELGLTGPGLLSDLEESFGVAFPPGLHADDPSETVNSLWWSVSTAVFCLGAQPDRHAREGEIR